jgi:hypothetical protein
MITHAKALRYIVLIAAALALAVLACDGVAPVVLTPASIQEAGYSRVKPTPTPAATPAYDGGDNLRTANTETLSLGTSGNGELTSTQQADNWLFEGWSGQSVAIQVISQGECDPRARLIDPHGNVIAEDDDGGGGFNALITLNLPLTGIYTVRVDAYTPGAYTITLQEMYAGGRSYGLLSYGDTVQGTITGTRSAENWNFIGAEGDSIAIYMEAADYDLDPAVRLIDAGDNEIGYDDDSGGGLNSYLLATLPADGLYTIVAQAYSGSGDYTLSLNLAPEPEAIAYGGTATGTIGGGIISGRYTFNGQAGDMIIVTMSYTSGDLNPTLALLSPQGDTVAYDDDSGGNLNALCFAILPSSGRYTIVAGRLGGSGNYEVHLNRVTQPETITYGDSVEASISNNTPYGLYTFEGQPGERIILSMIAADSGLDPRLQLYSPQGEQIAYDDDSGSGLNAAIQVTLTTEGLYTILALPYSGSGGYTLTLELTPPPMPITLGSEVTGELSDTHPSDVWSFEGQAGDIILISMEATSGYLEPGIELLGPNGILLAVAHPDYATTSTIASTLQVLPQTGIYTLVAESLLYSTGSYRLSVRLAPPPTPIVYGDTITSEISSNSPYGLWSFEGQAGDIVTISMTASQASELDPTLTLIGPDGAVLIYDDDSGSNLNALISSYRLPADGTYLIVGQPYSGRGQYTLSLQGQ